ncbi:MAG: hypothetical protein KAJ46_07930 [Sedimentisphaerales bacterium]|nr:hypothetical protein [Sedimentisphaerales bacterium]
MVKYVLLASILLGLIVISGCLKVQVDEPLVDLGDEQRYAQPARGEPSDEQAKIQWLRNRLARCRDKLVKKDRECDSLENKLDRCEDKLDRCEDKLD